jgi:LuxR family quorum-sensing system transcriptional regulator CciR
LINRLDLGELALALAADIESLSSIAQLRATLRRAMRPVGLTAAVCGVVSGPRLAAGERFDFVDWPQDWLDCYQAENFVRVDPVPRWTLATGRSASFAAAMNALPARDPGRRVGEAARSFGFGEGVILPIRASDGSIGVVSMGGDRDALSARERAYLRIVASLVFQRAATLREACGPTGIALSLTPRELDCLALLARGLTDRDIAAKLRVSEPTIRFHLNGARRKTGAISRAHLAALAIWLGFARL